MIAIDIRQITGARVLSDRHRDRKHQHPGRVVGDQLGEHDGRDIQDDQRPERIRRPRPFRSNRRAASRLPTPRALSRAQRMRRCPASTGYSMLRRATPSVTHPVAIMSAAAMNDASNNGHDLERRHDEHSEQDQERRAARGGSPAASNPAASSPAGNHGCNGCGGRSRDRSRQAACRPAAGGRRRACRAGARRRARSR